MISQTNTVGIVMPSIRIAAAWVLAGAFLSGQVLAISPELQRGEEGWFWYKDPKEKKPKPLPPAPPPAEAVAPEKPPEPPKLFSVKWLGKNLDSLREKAIDEPTDDNLKNYLYAQRAMMDKSDRFATRAMEVVQADPLLDERNRFPVSSFATNYLMNTAYEAKQKALANLSTRGGLWFFFDTSCRYCIIQQAAISNLVKEMGFAVLNVSMDGKGLPGMKDFVVDSGQYAKFDLKLLPAVVYAVPPQTYMVISQGALSTDDIKTRLLAYGKAGGMISKELEREIFLMDKGVLTTEDIKEIESKGVDPNDPGSWVKYLRKQLEGRYK